MTLNHLLFAVMSLFWGMTWIATKAGVTVVPPIFFAAVRFWLVAVTLLVCVRGVRAMFVPGRIGRVVLTAILVNVGTHSFLYWGMQFVATGIAAIVNLALMPVALYGLSIVLGDARPSWRHAAALVLGIVGLVVLFSQKVTVSSDPRELWGVAAILVATFSYALGSVLSRPLLNEASTLQITGAQGCVGALCLTTLSLALEPVSADTFRALLQPAPLAGVLFLAIVSTFIGYTIYLRLVRDWGAPRAGLYSFVSPVVALGLGSWLYGEPLGLREALGAAAMLSAAMIVLVRRRV